MNHFAVYLKLTQCCESTLFQYKIKIKKQTKNQNTLRHLNTAREDSCAVHEAPCSSSWLSRARGSVLEGLAALFLYTSLFLHFTLVHII